MFCDHCGKQIPNDAILCPYCGMSTGDHKQAMTYYDIAQQPEGEDAVQNASKDDFSQFGGPKPSVPYNAHASYQGGYRAVPRAPHTPFVSPMSPSVGYPIQRPGYGPSSMNYAGYVPQSPQFVPVVPVVVGQAHMKSENAVLLEVILSFFGVFGVGWLLGGATTTGIILLICSFVIYWPLLFFGTILTFGVGVLCLGPLAIVAIIINGVLCHSMLKRREARLMFMQQAPLVHVPPPTQRHVQQ